MKKSLVKDESGQAAVGFFILFTIITTALLLLAYGPIVDVFVEWHNDVLVDADDYPVSEARNIAIANQIKLVYGLPIIIVLMIIVAVIKNSFRKKAGEA